MAMFSLCNKCVVCGSLLCMTYPDKILTRKTVFAFQKEHCTVEPLYERHHWDPAGSPV